LVKSGKEIQDSKAAPQHGQLGADSDRGARRLSNKVEKIIDAAIKKIYLTAERPDVAAVVEEVNLQPALLPDGTDPDVGQQTNTDLHRSLLDLRGTRSCAERVLLAFGELRQTNIDLGLAGNARIVANAADPFDTPEQIVIRERINCVNSLAHWQIITESESIKEPRGRSHSQSYSQIALLHSHLFLHDQLTFADTSGTDIFTGLLIGAQSTF
jgi:hypothetical protein